MALRPGGVVAFCHTSRVPRGDPTKTIRLPVRLLDHLEERAARAGCDVATLIERRLGPRAAHASAPARARCACRTPKLSTTVSNLCTTCHLPR